MRRTASASFSQRLLLRGWPWSRGKCEGKNQATLSGLSPGELELRVEPSDPLGHFQVVYLVGHQRLNKAGWQELALTGGFDLDTQFLEQMVEAIEGLAG